MRTSRALIASSLSAAVALSLVPPAAAAAEAATHKKVVIDVWLADYPFPGYLDQRKQLAEEFNRAHPRYQVKVEAHDYTALPGKVAEAVSAGNPPEVANYYYNATQIARDARGRDGRPLFTSVQRAIGGRSHILGERVVLRDLLPQVRDYYTYRGDLMSFPVTSMTSLLYANTTVTARAGISRLPRTWAEIEAACARIATLPDAPEHCVTWPNHNWFFQQAIAQQDGLLTDRDNGRSGRATRVHLDSPQMLAYAGWWQRMHRAGHYRYSGTPEDWGANFESFVGQQVAFVLDAANMGDTYAQFGAEAGFGVGAAPLPHDGYGRSVGNVNSGDSLWLRAGLDRQTQDGALAFMQFLNSPRNSAAWHKSTSYLPMNTHSIQLLHQEGWFAEHPSSKVALDRIRTAKRSPAGLGVVTGAFDGIQNELVQAMDDVLLRGADRVARFRLADARAQRLLDAYNARCVGAGQRPAECYQVGVWG
ncbi:extracellular solute-binding protein [Micromonospora sp. KC721]|uniref:extracellular solute-binding protein n=1 Tax=Micromonospora sp. KC721 TaxID=2530380 RepID=UPI00104BA118|nr:extracellular solute-binding protein [Micromonospora sp. KC721]TDB81623.1 extracellular solute-binding protein [Micromonospora sp. KC721]